MAQRTNAAKLLIKPGAAVWISSTAHARLIEPLPDGASWTDAIADASVVLLFADSERALRGLLDFHADALTAPAYVWIAYPKGGRADINRDNLWPMVADAAGMRPITQVSLDDTWSALRFRPLKPDEPPFKAGSR
jgi:hypothetical protein